MIKSFGIAMLFTAVIILGVAACAKKEGTFFVGALGLNEDRVIIASQTAAAVTITSYDLEGNLLAVLADYYAETNGPRGLALFDALNFLVSLEGTDRLDLVYLGGGATPYLSSSFLGGAGAMGKLVRHPTTNDLFIIDAVTAIERFNLGGTRFPQTGNAFIQAAQAPCAAPASLRALAINTSGELVAIQSGSTAAFRYTIGPTVSLSCLTATLSVASNDLINHSNGFMYYAGTTNQIYRASQTLTGSVSIFNSAGTIAVPTAMAELPNGDLLIASDTTDSIEIISPDNPAVYRGSFVKNSHTALVHSILVVRGQ